MTKRKPPASLTTWSSPPCTAAGTSREFLLPSRCKLSTQKTQQAAGRKRAQSLALRVGVGLPIARSQESKCLDICLSRSYQKQVNGRKPSLSKASSSSSVLAVSPSSWRLPMPYRAPFPPPHSSNHKALLLPARLGDDHLRA